MERLTGLAARSRFRIVQLLRAVPIRWRILSIAALNSAVVVVLAALIWNGAQVLGSAWEDVRQVRESDKILARLESETSALATEKELSDRRSEHREALALSEREFQRRELERNSAAERLKLAAEAEE